MEFYPDFLLSNLVLAFTKDCQHKSKANEILICSNLPPSKLAQSLYKSLLTLI